MTVKLDNQDGCRSNHYGFVRGKFLQELIERVEVKIQEGWTPLGAPFELDYGDTPATSDVNWQQFMTEGI